MSEGKQVAHRPKSVSEALSSPAIKKRIEELLGKRAPQFCSTLVAISRQNAMLAKADPSSVIGAAITAATLDLPINPNLGFAYVVPYQDRKSNKTEAQFQIGYKGIIQLALRTGQYAALNDCVIPKGALVSYNELTSQLVVDFDKAEEGDPDGYAFYFELTNGFRKTAFWSRDKVEKHAARFSQAYRKGYGPWKDDFDQMALKTVLKNTLSKYGILSVEMQAALENDQAVSHGIDEDSTGLDYADNAEDHADPLEGMEPAHGVTEEKPSADSKKEPAAVHEDAGLTPVESLSKAACLAEINTHQNAPYFAGILDENVSAGLDVKDCQVSMLRGIVLAMRAESEK